MSSPYMLVSTVPHTDYWAVISLDPQQPHVEGGLPSILQKGDQVQLREDKGSAQGH